MDCSICNKPIILVPSAKERAAKFGGKPSDYTKIFTAHAECLIAKRESETVELIRKAQQTVASHVPPTAGDEYDKSFLRGEVKDSDGFMEAFHGGGESWEIAEALRRVESRIWESACDLPSGDEQGHFDAYDLVKALRESIESDADDAERIKCDDCVALMINGVFCHETGCRNTNSRYDADSETWVKQRVCFDCGCTVDADDPCCSAQPDDE
jgi:hypothetical protein